MPTTTDVAVDLVQWLRAQLDEDERIARAATQGDWVWSREFVTPPGYHHRTVGPLEPGDAAYMTTWAPARVLREVDAKRQLIARGGPFCTSDCDAPGNEPMDPETDWTTPLEHHLDCAAYKAAAVLALPHPPTARPRRATGRCRPSRRWCRRASRPCGPARRLAAAGRPSHPRSSRICRPATHNSRPTQRPLPRRARAWRLHSALRRSKLLRRIPRRLLPLHPCRPPRRLLSLPRSPPGRRRASHASMRRLRPSARTSSTI